jgi:hypothetical protein
MLHLTRCCLCVTLLAVTTAFAQTSTIQSESPAGDALKAGERKQVDSSEPLEKKRNDGPVAQDDREDQRRRVLTRAITSLEKRLKEPAPNARKSGSRMKRDPVVSMVVSIQPLIRLGLEESDIMSALEMIDQLEEGATISTNFHQATGLLFIKTGFDTISLVDDVLEQLDVTAQTNAERPRRRGTSRSMKR